MNIYFLIYSLSNYDDSPAICSTNCYGYESRLTSCYLQQCSDYNYYSNYHSSYDRCSYVVTLNCGKKCYINFVNRSTKSIMSAHKNHHDFTTFYCHSLYFSFVTTSEVTLCVLRKKMNTKLVVQTC